MKRFVAIVLAVLMLGLAIPKQSEANGAVVWAAIMAGQFLGALIDESSHAYTAYPAYVPERPDVYGPPARTYAKLPPMPPYPYRYGQGYRESRQGYGRDIGRLVPPQYGWRRPIPRQYGWRHSYR
jgi:hypothetical protein